MCEVYAYIYLIHIGNKKDKINICLCDRLCCVLWSNKQQPKLVNIFLLANCMCSMHTKPWSSSRSSLLNNCVAEPISTITAADTDNQHRLLNSSHTIFTHKKKILCECGAVGMPVHAYSPRAHRLLVHTPCAYWSDYTSLVVLIVCEMKAFSISSGESFSFSLSLSLSHPA